MYARTADLCDSEGKCGDGEKEVYFIRPASSRGIGYLAEFREEEPSVDRRHYQRHAVHELKSRRPWQNSETGLVGRMRCDEKLHVR